MKNKVFGGVLLLPFSFIFSYIFASLLSVNEIVYFSFTSRTPDFYIIFFILLILSFAASAGLIFTSLGKKISDFFNLFERHEGFDLLAFILGAAVTVLFYLLAYNGPVDDYQPHTEFALAFDWSELGKSLSELSHPLWHIVTNLFVKVFYLPSNCACALSTAFFCSMIFIFTRGILVSYVSERKYYFLCDITAALLMFMQPLYIKQFNSQQITGQGSPFMLHNPTNLTVQPLALICTYLFFRILKRQLNGDGTHQLKDYLRLSLFSFLSVLAKPAFLQVFIPAIFVIFLIRLIRYKFKDFGFCLKLTAVFLPSLLYIVKVMLFEFFSPASEDSGGIAFGFFEVWRAHSPFVPLSIILAAGFCLLYMILKNVGIKHKLEIRFILLCWLVGILEFGFIMETGYRKYHGNFSWGYCISLSLMYVFVTAELLTNILSKPFSTKNIGIPELLTLALFSVQLIQGSIYFFSLI